MKKIELSEYSDYEEVEFKDCPFCGSEARILIDETNAGAFEIITIECWNCKMAYFTKKLWFKKPLKAYAAYPRTKKERQQVSIYELRRDAFIKDLSEKWNRRTAENKE